MAMLTKTHFTADQIAFLASATLCFTAMFTFAKTELINWDRGWLFISYYWFIMMLSIVPWFPTKFVWVRKNCFQFMRWSQYLGYVTAVDGCSLLLPNSWNDLITGSGESINVFQHFSSDNALTFSYNISIVHNRFYH